MSDNERAMAEALNEINKLVFATVGQPLDADRYFKIRGLCADTLKKCGHPVD